MDNLRSAFLRRLLPVKLLGAGLEPAWDCSRGGFKSLVHQQTGITYIIQLTNED